jgi:hypothetical protein
MKKYVHFVYFSIMNLPPTKGQMETKLLITITLTEENMEGNTNTRQNNKLGHVAKDDIFGMNSVVQDNPNNETTFSWPLI